MLLGLRTVLALVGLYAVLLVVGIDPASMLIDWITQEVSNLNLW